jgi:TfoX N-terminal domain
MAYDEQLTNQFREALGKQKGLAEKKMMGGMCFLIDGNMVGGADRTKDGQGRLMFRVGKENDAIAAELPGAQEMKMGGRRMSGLYFVNEEDCKPDVMTLWIDLALGFVTSLPPK